MKYIFDKAKLNAKYRTYIILCAIICVIFTIVNRLYNTLANSTELTLPLIIILIMFVFLLVILFFIRHIEYRTYKGSYISIYKGVVKFRINNMQNFWGAHFEYPEHKQYNIEPEKFLLGRKSITIYGKADLLLVDENDTKNIIKQVKKIKIPDYYNDWQKFISKIKIIFKN